MNRIVAGAMGVGIMVGAVGCAGSGEGGFIKGRDPVYSPEQMGEMQAHMQTDLDNRLGTLVSAAEPVRIQWQGDLYTLPTEGMQSGQTLPYQEAVEVDLPWGGKDGSCKDLKLPNEVYKLDVKIAQNNKNEPIITQVAGTALRVCNDSESQPGTAVIQVSEKPELK